MFMIWAWMGTCLDYEGEKSHTSLFPSLIYLNNNPKLKLRGKSVSPSSSINLSVFFFLLIKKTDKQTKTFIDLFFVPGMELGSGDKDMDKTHFLL